MPNFDIVHKGSFRASTGNRTERNALWHFEKEIERLSTYYRRLVMGH